MKWILVAVMALILQLFLPWWSITIAACIYGFLFVQKPAKSFLEGFLGIFLFWGTTTIIISYVNNGILAGRLAELFSLPHGILVILITALIGGLAGGVFATTGTLLRCVLMKKKQNNIPIRP